MLYTANLHAIESRSPTPPQPAEHARFGAYILQGRVVDSAGNPVYGAAIELGPNLLFTDSDGSFFLRDNKPRTYVFKVLLEQFLDGRYYKVLSQPSQVTAVKTEDQHLLIVVSRIEAPPQSAAAACDPIVGPQGKQRSSSSQPQTPPCAATATPPSRTASSAR